MLFNCSVLGPEINISDLLNDSDAMTTLASSMDNYHEKNHVLLGEYLIANVPQNQIPGKKKLNSLQRYHFGGGSPTLAFLTANHSINPNDLVKKLRDYAKKVKREDLIVILEPIHDDVPLKELTDAKNLEIADLLDQRIPGVSDWESFASHFNYDYVKRQEFLKERITPGSFSPTKALIEILHGVNSKLPISHIINWAVSHGRNDIANHLKDFTKEKEGMRQLEDNQNATCNQQVTNDLDSSRADFALTPEIRTGNLNQPAGPTESDDTSRTTTLDATDGGPFNEIAGLSLDGNGEPDLT